jgi:hypothetical protein
MTKSLQNLKRITKELAEEIHEDRLYDSDSVFCLVTTLLDHIPVLCEIVSPDYEIIYVNEYTKNHVKRMGGDEPKVGGKCFAEMFGVDHPCDKCPLKKAIESGDINAIDFVAPHDDGGRYDVGMGGNLIAIPLKWNGTSAVILIGKSPAETMKVDCNESD